MKSQYEDWPDDASTIAEPSQDSINREAEYMVRNMKKAFKGKDRAVIGVLRSEAISHVEDGLKPALWKRMFGKKLEDYPLLVTTVEDLLVAIEIIRKEFRHCKVLTILVSTQVDALYPFAVGSRIQTLQIFRCGPNTDRNGRLLITGDSTFNKISLDKWQEEERNGRKLLVGDGVGVRVNSKWRSSPASSAFNLDKKDQQEELKAHLEAMRKGKMHRNWWKRWKGPVAAILGLATATGKIVVGLKVAAGGAFVDFNCAAFSLKAGIVGLKASTVATVMGPAVLLGVGVAAAVYFIPWDDLISWIGSLISRLSSWIARLWEGFLSWWNQWLEDIQTWWRQWQDNHAARPSKRGPQPMRFH